MRFILVIGMLFAGLVISGTFGQTVFADGPEEPPHTATTPAPDPIQPVAIHELLHRVNEANDPQSVWGALSAPRTGQHSLTWKWIELRLLTPTASSHSTETT